MSKETPGSSRPSLQIVVELGPKGHAAARELAADLVRAQRRAEESGTWTRF